MMICSFLYPLLSYFMSGGSIAGSRYQIWHWKQDQIVDAYFHQWFIMQPLIFINFSWAEFINLSSLTMSALLQGANMRSSPLTNSKLMDKFKGIRSNCIKMETVEDIQKKYNKKQTSIRYSFLKIAHPRKMLTCWSWLPPGDSDQHLLTTTTYNVSRSNKWGHNNDVDVVVVNVIVVALFVASTQQNNINIIGL